MCACMDVTTQLEFWLHEQTQIVANVACRVGSQQFFNWIASYLFPYILLQSLNFYLFLV